MKAGWSFALFLVVLVYIVVGGVVFSVLERDNEQQVADQAHEAYLGLLENHTCIDKDNFTAVLGILMQAYMDGFISGPDATARENSVWSISSAIFFAVTCVTTIGYGHISPSTTGGRFFFTFYVIFGIPLTLMLLAYIGVGLSKLSNSITKRIRLSNNPKLNNVFSIFVLSVLGILVFFIIPAGVFNHTENWSYQDGIYYSVVTLSTVGFGDYVAGVNSKAGPLAYFYRFMLIAWIFLGLAWFAGVIAIVQEYMADRVDKVEQAPDDAGLEVKGSSVSLAEHTKTDNLSDGTSGTSDVTLTGYSSIDKLKDP